MVAFPEPNLFQDTPPLVGQTPLLHLVPPVVTASAVEHEVQDCFDDENIAPDELDAEMPSLTDPATVHGGAYALFPYQAEAVAELENGFFVDELRSQRLVVPTAGGKTVIFSTFIKRRALAGDSVLVLVHRNKLLRQASEKLNKFGIFPLIEQGSNHALPQFGGATRVVIASVQSLHRDRAKRWARDSFDWIVSDECVTGDTIVLTNKGAIPISDIPTVDATYVMSYTGNQVAWRKITAHLPQGQRATIKITLADGRIIRCTKNHPIYTSHGWVESGNLELSHRVLCLAPADAEPPSRNTARGGASAATSRGTRRVSRKSCAGHHIVAKNASLTAPTTTACVWQRRRFVSVAAEPRLACAALPTLKPFSERAQRATTNTSWGTTSARQTGTLNYLKTNFKRCWGRCWGTVVSAIQTTVAATQECLGHTAQSNAYGWSTKSTSLAGWGQPLGKWSVPVMEPRACTPTRPACRASNQSSIYPMTTALSASQSNGSIRLALLGWRGGLATMGRRAVTAFGCICKATRWQISNSRRNGLGIALARPQSTIAEAIMSFTYPPTVAAPSCHLSNHTSPTVCNTSYVPVVSIEEGEVEDVFDITVDGTHCFFANGMLVHNCHHCRKEPNNHWFKLVRYFNTARHLGVTATPGVMKGKKYVDVGPFQRTVEPLTLGVGIQQGYLSRLVVKRCRTDIDLSNIGSVAGDFKQNELDTVIYENTNKLATAIKENIGARPTYVFTPQVHSAVGLAKALNDLGVKSRAISYHNTEEEDEQIHRDHAAGVFQVLCNAMKLTEGVDAPFVECVVLARPTQSVNVYRQCVGRGLRLSRDTGKENCLILDFGFVTARLKLAGSPQQVNDLFTEDEDAEALEAVMQEFMDEASEAGQAVDILEALDAARERLQEREAAQAQERERVARIAAEREAARARHREQHFDYTAVEYDPMVTELLNIPERTALNWTNTAECEPATDEQKAYITKRSKGKIKVEDLTKRSAGVVIGEIQDADKKGLSSIPQRNVLMHKLGKWNLPPEVARAMPRLEASAYIDLHKQWG